MSLLSDQSGVSRGHLLRRVSSALSVSCPWGVGGTGIPGVSPVSDHAQKFILHDQEERLPLWFLLSSKDSEWQRLPSYWSEGRSWKECQWRRSPSKIIQVTINHWNIWSKIHLIYLAITKDLPCGYIQNSFKGATQSHARKHTTQGVWEVNVSSQDLSTQDCT